MKSTRKLTRLLLAAVFVLGGALPAAAAVKSQCPGFVPGVDSDLNGDHVLRFSDGELTGTFTLPNGHTQATLDPGEDVACKHLAAGDGLTKMADGYPQYVFGFSDVTGIPDSQVMNMWDAPNPGAMMAVNFPAPTIVARQGDHFYLSLTNVGMVMRPDLFDPHTVHWHGFPNASSVFDGVPEASIAIGMGATLTYYYQVIEPGTYIYHCHVEAAEHMQMGMLGNLFVTPAQDGNPINFGGRTYTTFAYNDGDGSTGYDVDYHIQIAGFDPKFHDASLAIQPLPFATMVDKYPMLNGRGYPDTVDPGNISNELGYESQRIPSLVTAASGDRILLRISSLSTTTFHTLTLPGIPMQVVGTGARKLGPQNNTSQYYLTSSVNLGGGEAVDVILDTQGVPPGTYYLYASQLDHLNNNEEEYGGMMTEIRIQP